MVKDSLKFFASREKVSDLLAVRAKSLQFNVETSIRYITIYINSSRLPTVFVWFCLFELIQLSNCPTLVSTYRSLLVTYGIHVLVTYDFLAQQFLIFVLIHW